MNKLTPSNIVVELDKYIVGQSAAKRAVAIAVRNRYRRQMLIDPLRNEVTPKNILMIGPTGVGKTEIARRLARLVGAPFVKIEATKYTEVGYVGKDVEGMIRELVETSIRMVKTEKALTVMEQASEAADERLIDALLGSSKKTPTFNPFAMIFGNNDDQEDVESKADDGYALRQELLVKLKSGLLENETVDITTTEAQINVLEGFAGLGIDETSGIQELMSGLMPKRSRQRHVKVSEARRLLQQEEAQRLVDTDEAVAEGLRRAEQNGIIFLDELDKIAGASKGTGPDVSREGVQRDLLPILEGSNVSTKYGSIATDHILFISAGAFHVSKPSDLIPELQGRFPIRVELSSLTRQDFVRILTEPQNALTYQYRELLAVDGVVLSFTSDGINMIAELAFQVNDTQENIGARRLYTMMEKLLEDVSFDAPYSEAYFLNVDANYVRTKLSALVHDTDLSRYIL